MYEKCFWHLGKFCIGRISKMTACRFWHFEQLTGDAHRLVSPIFFFCPFLQVVAKRNARIDVALRPQPPVASSLKTLPAWESHFCGVAFLTFVQGSKRKKQHSTISTDPHFALALDDAGDELSLGADWRIADGAIVALSR